MSNTTRGKQDVRDHGLFEMPFEFAAEASQLLRVNLEGAVG